MEEQVVDEKKRKRLETQKRYRQNNKEKIKEVNKQYKLKNKEKLNEKKKQYQLENKEKIKEKNKRYHLENREKNKQYRLVNKERYKHNHLKRRYNITLDAYNKMLQEQNGSCAICFVKAEEQKNKVLVVDHNHLTGEVRGLLCNPCNAAIGLLKESQEVIENALKYLYEKGSCVLKEVG